VPFENVMDGSHRHIGQAPLGHYPSNRLRAMESSVGDKTLANFENLLLDGRRGLLRRCVRPARPGLGPIRSRSLGDCATCRANCANTPDSHRSPRPIRRAPVARWLVCAFVRRP
jgi:hypothetical protein